ncbi:CPCC family cysteine-rich protein [Lacipirellula sp.]|uniref:CPCC family cysteine-rich protein n=1 Tax=Lacipirellula sp. TaxID=2691419 RepID=UPI003D128985
MECTCPCCGYITIESRGSSEICPICYWEDDPVQFENPDFAGGQNPFSLRQSQQNYLSIGACDDTMLENVRPANEGDRRDLAWSPLQARMKYRRLILPGALFFLFLATIPFGKNPIGVAVFVAAFLIPYYVVRHHGWRFWRRRRENNPVAEQQ